MVLWFRLKRAKSGRRRRVFQMYWTDSSLQTIKRAMVPEDPNTLGFAQDLQIEMVRQPDGIAFDWVARCARLCRLVQHRRPILL